VDREALEQLGTLGYEQGLAAEALRGTDNNLQVRGWNPRQGRPCFVWAGRAACLGCCAAHVGCWPRGAPHPRCSAPFMPSRPLRSPPPQSALDVLSDPVRAGALQLAMVARQIKEAEEGPQGVSSRDVARLREMGFAERPARVALKEARGSFEEAVEALMAQGEVARAGAGGGGEGRGGGDGEGGSGGAEAGGAAAAGGDAGLAEGTGGRRRRGRRLRRPRRLRGGARSSPSVSGSSSSGSEGPMDSEEERMQEDIIAAARGGGDDPMAAYDLDLEAEGDAIERYLGLLQQPQGTPA
jgi:hypothetical protein